MKKIFMFLLAGVFCAGFAACSDDDDEEGAGSSSGSSYSSSAIVGTWRLDYAYEGEDYTYNGNRFFSEYYYYYSEYSIQYGGDEKIVFYEDGTVGWWDRNTDGTWVYDYDEEVIYWKLSGSTLSFVDGEEDSEDYQIVELTSTTLIFEFNDEDEDYRFWAYYKYVKE